MEFYSSQSSADERAMYDRYRSMTGDLLKKLEETLYGYSEYGARFQEYQAGKTPHPESSFEPAEYHTVAALYYARVLSDLPSADAVKQKEKQALMQVIQHHYQKALQEGSTNHDLRGLKSFLEGADAMLN
tara:strand:- start:144 stop:533 length:390 start_codon:yes stop_codon:yes gene_type:complete